MLTYDLLTSGSMRAEVLPYGSCAPSLMLIAQLAFLLERGHTRTDKVTGATDHPTLTSAH